MKPIKSLLTALLAIFFITGTVIAQFQQMLPQVSEITINENMSSIEIDRLVYSSYHDELSKSATRSTLLESSDTQMKSGLPAAKATEPGTPGLILFSKYPIDPLNPQNLTNHFEAGDYIYGIVWFEKSLKEIYNDANLRLAEFMIRYEIDYLRTTSGSLEGDKLENDYIVFEVIPDPILATSYSSDFFKYNKYPNPAACDGPIRIANDFQRLEAGQHNIKFVFNLNYQDMAEGELIIEGTDFSVYNDIMHGIIEGADEQAMAAARMPQAGMSDSSTELAMMEAFTNSNDWRTGRIRAAEALRLVIVDPQWYTRHHAITGNILHRYIRASIAVKDNDGNCYYYPLVTFQEDYVGGNFQPLKYDGAGDRVPILCNNVDK